MFKLISLSSMKKAAGKTLQGVSVMLSIAFTLVFCFPTQTRAAIGDVSSLLNNAGIQVWNIDQSGNQTIYGNMMPTASATQNLGSTASPWQNVYASNLVGVTLQGTKDSVGLASGATYAIAVTDKLVDSTYSATSTQTITLPAPATVGAGYSVKVVDFGNTAATHTITVAHHASESIFGTATITTNGGVRTFCTDGTNWDAQ